MQERSSTSNAVALFLLGALTLFLELALIRYLAGSVWNLGYFPNLVLMAVFIGMGVGFVLHHHLGEKKSGWLFEGSVLLVLGIVAGAAFFSPAVPGFGQLGGDIGGEVYFTATPERKEYSYLFFAVCFLGIAAAFALIAQRTAKVFRLFPALRAYTLDIGGSCSGIVLFMLMSWFRVPAWGWFLIAGLLFVAAMPPAPVWRRALVLAPFALISVMVHWQDGHLMSNPKYKGELEVRWSPYQKVEYINDPRNRVSRGLYVNGISHQAMLTPEQIKAHFYQVPYDLRKKSGHEPYKTALIIGAGSGNDVTAAIMNGVEYVDAVEIDPEIAAFGKKHHPSKAYHDPKVHLTIDDARAFMTRTDKKYDLIVFALTDSLVKVSSMSQLRLENFLFTTDSVKRAYELLSPTGDLVLYNYYRRPWIVTKYTEMMRAATGKYPENVYKKGDFEMLMAGKTRAEGAPPPAVAGTVDIPTDNWPFPYLKDKEIPTLYIYALIGALLVVSLLGAALHFVNRGHSEYVGSKTLFAKLAFIVMGTAFLLLETKSIVQFSLLFGTTWRNTSFVFLGILGLVLAANWAATLLHGRRALVIVYVLLVLSSLLPLVFPLSGLLGVESVAVRFILASLMTFAPVFFANLVFSIALRDQQVPEHLFGWNLLGATLGGILEYTSMATGYAALAIIVAVCYTLAFIFLRLSQPQVQAVAEGAGATEARAA